MFRIFQNLKKKDWGLFVIALALIVTQVWLDLKLPDYMSEITQLIETPDSAMADVLKAGGKMLACAFGSMAMATVVAVIASRVASDFSANTRKKIYDSVQSFSMAEIQRFSNASLITRTTNDVTQVQTLIVMGMQVIIKAPILAVWALLKIANKNATWTMSTGVAVVILSIIITIVISLCLPRFRRIQSLTDDVNRVTRENLTGLKVVRAYNAEDYETKKFEGVNKTLTDTNLFTGHAMAFMLPSIQAIMSGLTLSIYWIGAYLINEAAMQDKISLFSNMIVFSSYALQVIMAFMMLVMIFILYPRASVAAKRILEVTDTSSSIKDGKETAGVCGKAGEVEFKNVSFRYPDAKGGNVLSNISFKAEKGETVALIGATGSGKSTIINLIPRFYDTTEGEVLVDGRNVREYTQEALHNKIGYVSQTAQLFKGTIRSNIGYGDNGSADTDKTVLARAASVAEAEEFISEKEEDMDSYVAQNGSNFSGGQRQRVSIARAIARNAEILIFDDSFSALDYRTDRKVRNNLKKECTDATKIIVAQRIGTVRDADKILVIADGRIAGEGTHQELMETCDTYKEIALSQLSKEELA
jgi:ATP-binding cassette subfamily B multidrug efflux pump